MFYGKAVKTETNWVTAYELVEGGYAISSAYIGTVPKSEQEPEFETLEELEAAMAEIAPLLEWSDELFQNIVE